MPSPSSRLTVAAPGEPLTGLAQQALHADGRSPGRQGVVADVHRPAGAHLVAQQAHDAVLDGLRDPAPDAVHGDEISLGDLPPGGILGQGREIGLDEGDVGSLASAAHSRAAAIWAGLKSTAVTRQFGIARRQHHRAKALTTAQFQQMHRVVGLASAIATLPSRQASAIIAGDCWRYQPDV